MKHVKSSMIPILGAFLLMLAFVGTAYGDKDLATVRSDYRPSPGQTHRSSDNFSTQDAPRGTQSLCFRVSGNSNADRITFDVMEDRRRATDPVIYSRVRNGNCGRYISSEALYIANPSGAEGHEFLVTVIAR